MARYEQSFSGERRTSWLHMQLTPGERAQLEAGAHQTGSPSLSAFVRVLCLRRVPEAAMLAGIRQNPDAKKLAFELHAIGKNLNQLAHIANATGAVSAENELRATIGLLKAAIARVIAL